MKKLLLALLLPSVVTAQVYDGKGEHNNCAIAESKAFEHALKQANGMLIESVETYVCADTKNKDPSCQYQKESETYAAGQINKVISSKTIIRNGICHSEVKVLVNNPASIYVTVNGRSEFKNGDIVEYTVNARQPVHMYVFAVYKDGVDLIHPLQYNMDRVVNGKFIFPSDFYKLNSIHIEAKLKDGVNFSKETLVFIFTSTKLNFDYDNISKKHLDELIKTLPVYSRRVVYKDYSIFRL